MITESSGHRARGGPQHGRVRGRAGRPRQARGVQGRADRSEERRHGETRTGSERAVQGAELIFIRRHRGSESALAKKVGRLQHLLHATDGYVTRRHRSQQRRGGCARRVRVVWPDECLHLRESSLRARCRSQLSRPMARNSSVMAVRPALSRARAPASRLRRATAQRTDDVRRNFGLTGHGVKIGVLSDSFNCLHAPLTDDPLASFTTAAAGRGQRRSAESCRC